jgi:hypothetical protein
MTAQFPKLTGNFCNTERERQADVHSQTQRIEMNTPFRPAFLILKKWK